MKKTSGWLLLAASLAWPLFALTFRGPRTRFWDRMTFTGLALGLLALTARPSLRRTRLGVKEIGAGLGAAGLLYLIFQLGDRITRRVIPGGGAQIDAIYALRRIRPHRELMARLGLIIGPSEELFWRGFLQAGLMERFGRLWGTLLGAAAYASVHLPSGNFTLIGAAAVAGGFWAVLYSLGVPLGALIVSHIVWDNVIFLIAPTTKLSAEMPAAEPAFSD
jgi:membrane protease YdiL (CAAX protease family)